MCVGFTKLIGTHTLRALGEIFQDAGWKTKEIVKTMMIAEEFYYERIGVVKMKRWSQGRVVSYYEHVGNDLWVLSVLFAGGRY